MFGTLKTLAVAGAVAASALMTTAAQAQGRIVGLVDGKSIVTIDPRPARSPRRSNINGAGPILGIDVRPADGMLYGVTSDGNIVTIDAEVRPGDDEEQAQPSRGSARPRPPSTSTRSPTACA